MADEDVEGLTEQEQELLTGALENVRDRIRICGRLQSRLYTKLTEEGPQERTAYEISALTAEILEEQI